MKKDFVWTDDKVELLLNVTHKYKVQHLVEATCWESVHLKYTDILELFRNELIETEAKKIVTDKMKAIRTKYH